MSKQYNKEIKKKRRKAYDRRRKARILETIPAAKRSRKK